MVGVVLGVFSYTKNEKERAMANPRNLTFKKNKKGREGESIKLWSRNTKSGEKETFSDIQK